MSRRNRDQSGVRAFVAHFWWIAAWIVTAVGVVAVIAGLLILLADGKV